MKSTGWRVDRHPPQQEAGFVVQVDDFIDPGDHARSGDKLILK
jgi:hypothetical protein